MPVRGNCRFALLCVAVAGAVLLGSGCSSGDRGEPSAVATQVRAAVLIAPEAFAERIASPDVVTVNVHVPNEGNIGGTDLSIPFDQIADSDQLPADRSTPLAVYCRSGNMSADAVQTLRAMGYDDIVELDGGYNEWIASGRTLEPT